jgi:hypothetical protein
MILSSVGFPILHSHQSTIDQQQTVTLSPPVHDTVASSETPPSKKIPDHQTEEEEEQALVASFTRKLTLESKETDREEEEWSSSLSRSILASSSSLTARDARVIELYRIPKFFETYELHFLLRDYQHLGYRVRIRNSSNHDNPLLIVFKTSEDGKFFFLFHEISR